MAQQALPVQRPTRPDHPEVTPRHPARGAASRLVFLDRLDVTEGVYRQTVLRAVGDLVLGDEFRFPPLAQQAECSVATDGTAAVVRMSTPVQVGQTSFAARHSHHVTLMSDLGQVLQADLFIDASGRPFLGLAALTDPERSYTLIAMSAPVQPMLRHSGVSTAR